MKTRHHRLAALVAAGALTFSVAACGSDSDDPVVEPDTTSAGEQTPDDAAETGDAAPETEDTETAAEETAEDTGSAAEGEEISAEDFMAMLKAPGEEKLGSFTVEMNLGGQGQEITMQGAADMRGENPLMHLNMNMSGMGEMEILMADGEVFMSIPGMTEEGQYLRMDPAELGMDLEELTGTIDMDSTFAAWDEGTQTVSYVGSEDVDGEQLERYTLEVDAAAAMQAQGETMQPGMPDTITYDVWLDAENLMRKVSFDMQGITAEMLVDNWGEDVDIQVPDESQITDFTG